MILHGNQRGGGNNLAIHLMKPENERVEIVEMRGFASDNLKDAFAESYAISKTTKCTQHLFSTSINPPADAEIENKEYVDAADRIESKLELSNQPRAIVRHWKRGDDGILRSHAHVVWCRVDAEKMKAVPLPFTKLRLRDVSRELHIEHDLKMPRGLINSNERDPKNFTLEQWQQCKRAKKNIRQLQSDFMDAWAMSDNQASFAHALAERGYILAKGRRGFVAVDHKGEVYAVRSYAGVKSEDVNARLGKIDKLPSIDEAQVIAAKQITERLIELCQEQAGEIKLNRAYVCSQDERSDNQFDRQQKSLLERLARNKDQEAKLRISRLRKGVPGLWDWITGRRRKTLKLNQAEMLATRQRHRNEMCALKNKHLSKIKTQHEQARAARSEHFEAMKELRTDIARLREPPEPKPEKTRTRKPAFEQPRRRSRSRDGLKYER